MKPIRVERTIDWRSGVVNVWQAITDTERMNRAIGNARPSLRALEGPTAARYLSRARLGGFEVEYEEYPYEWEFLRRFQILRRMHNGPVAELEFIFTLEPLPSDGTRVRLQITLMPRVALLSPLIRLNAGRVADRMRREMLRLDEQLVSGAPAALEGGRIAEAALERARAELASGHPPPHLDRLVALVRSGDDVDVSRMRPYALADRWGVPRSEVLATCLRAVKAGLLELRWDIVCPSCRTASRTLPSLDELADHGECQVCEIGFGLALDQSVEATFAPSRSIRRVDEGPYCVGGPGRTPHVVAQTVLPPNGTRALRAPAEPGEYRLFVRGGFVRRIDLADGAPEQVEVSPPEAPLRLTVAPGGALLVRNPNADERHAKLERAEWRNDAATARDVTTMAEFRREFSSEVLRPGVQLEVSRMGLFFSDLSDSTRLYADAGDATAFRLVQDHFELLRPIIERHGGAVVKTIGDAVMAAFVEDHAALAACREMLAAFERFRREHTLGERTHLKLGYFSGPCFVLTANNVLDYFGQTVNIAARLQGQARSGELVIEAGFADEAIRSGALTEAEVLERYEATLKGVARPIRVARVGALTPATGLAVSG